MQNMILRSLYLTKDQYRALKDFNIISVSEHIRRAIDEYIEKRKRSLELKVTISPSGNAKKEIGYSG